MLKEKITFKREKAVLLTVDLSAPTIEAYAMAFLKLYNNAREYREMIYKMENDRGNKVYLICNQKSSTAVKEFCNGIYVYHDMNTHETEYIGKVVGEEEIIIGVPIYEYNSTCKFETEQWFDDIDQSIMYWKNVEEE